MYILWINKLLLIVKKSTQIIYLQVNNVFLVTFSWNELVFSLIKSWGSSSQFQILREIYQFCYLHRLLAIIFYWVLPYVFLVFHFIYFRVLYILFDNFTIVKKPFWYITHLSRIFNVFSMVLFLITYLFCEKTNYIKNIIKKVTSLPLYSILWKQIHRNL